MVLERIKGMFSKEVNTEGFTTGQFVSVLQKSVPGSGYDKIKTLRQGIEINGNRLTPEDIQLKDTLVAIAVEHTKVTDPELFRKQLESYICSGDVMSPSDQEESPALHLNETMRVETPGNTEPSDARERLSVEELKKKASELSAEADSFMEKMRNEFPSNNTESPKIPGPLNEVDQAHIARAKKANNPHGFEEVQPVIKRTGT